MVIPAALSFTIPGRPVPSKNSRQMWNGKIVKGSKAYLEYRDFCLGTRRRPGWLCQYGNYQFSGPVRVDAHYWLPDYRWWPDLTGLLQTTGDILEGAGLLVNDRQIISWGSSRIVGISLEPRTEITISETTCDWWKG